MHEDAHIYAAEAADRGAAAIVCERRLPLDVAQLVVPDGREAMANISAAFYRHPEREMKMVGITGTNGKTTTAAMTAAILQEAGIPAGRVGTLGAEYGKIVVPPSLTTPDPVSLFSLLRDMADAGMKAAVMEGLGARARAEKGRAHFLRRCGLYQSFARSSGFLRDDGALCRR